MSNLEAYAEMIGRLTSAVERNLWIAWVIFMLPLVPAVAFRSAITMFIVMVILAVALLAFPIYQGPAVLLWGLAAIVSTVGGAYHLRYRQAERHQHELLQAIKRGGS